MFDTKRANGLGRTAISFRHFDEPLRPHRNQPTWLVKHDFGDRRRNWFTEKTIALTVVVVLVRPGRKFIGRRIMPEIHGAAAHDEAKHHLGSVLRIAKTIHKQCKERM